MGVGVWRVGLVGWVLGFGRRGRVVSLEMGLGSLLHLARP